MTKEIIETLLQNIDKKSTLYLKQGKPILANLFLLNNYYYISKFLKANPKLVECGKELSDKIAVMAEMKRVDYFEGYNMLLDGLIKGGTRCASS